MRIPPYLKPGDTIGIVCPAGYMATERAGECIETLQEWGFKVKTGKTLGSASTNYFSGTDEERLTDLQEMLDDDAVQAILFGRGGYGMSRIVDRIDFTKFREKPKWIAGFSDITLLHLHIQKNYSVSTLHAPMAGAFRDGESGNEYVRSLRDCFLGMPVNYNVDGHPDNRPGIAEGKLIGGNLSLLINSLGTSSEPDTNGAILFLEEVDEYLYSIDRMLMQLLRAGKLSRLAGLIVGGFSGTKDTERPFGNTLNDLIKEKVEYFNYPVCFGFPVSHDRENYALKCGVEYRLSVKLNEVRLFEQ